MNKQEMRKLATVYTIKHSNENDLPERYKKNKVHDPTSKNKVRKAKKGSMIEARFQQNIAHFITTFEKIFELIPDKDKATRFITLAPKIEDGTTRLIDNQDYVDFLDLLIQRRDVDVCDDIELGKLAIIQSSFSKKVEEAIYPKTEE